MKYRMLTATLVGAALIVGCGEQNAPTESQDTLTNPTLNFTNGPPVAGIVVRGEILGGVYFYDPKAGMIATIGFDPNEYCLGIYDWDIWPYQDVELPRDDRLLSLIQGHDTRTAVWGFPSFDCALFATETPLASGVSDVVATWNDSYQTGSQGAVAFGYRAHGVLTRPNGARAIFNGHWNALYNAAGVTWSNQIVLR